MVGRAECDSHGVIFWFRQDLRLHDQLALDWAIQRAHSFGGWLLPVWVDDQTQQGVTRWGFSRMGIHRQRWRNKAVLGLTTQLQALQSDLLALSGDSPRVLADLVKKLSQAGATVELVCEEILAPEEEAMVVRLRELGVYVHTIWQSTLLSLHDLPFDPAEVPDVFTQFRQAVEQAQVSVQQPLAVPRYLPPLPKTWSWDGLPKYLNIAKSNWDSSESDPRSSFPYELPKFDGSEVAALSYLNDYCDQKLPHSYKATRNNLSGLTYSSKWSPWLSTGALSPRRAWDAIQQFAAEFGANEGTYWLWFELLWRDHFRFLHHKHGKALYRSQGLSQLPSPIHDESVFMCWSQGDTGHPFIDAGMQELNSTGYLSNRMRQIVASYLLNELSGDWRAGAAWFESQLIDFDVYSNQGNWLYLSGRGTDPRGKRRFNPEKQAQDYDPEYFYRQLWGKST